MNREVTHYHIREDEETTADTVFIENGIAYLGISIYDLEADRYIILPVFRNHQFVLAPADWRERID